VDWEQAKPITVETQGMFDLGRHLEELGKDYLRRIGYRVKEQKDYFHWKEKHISGVADCWISNEEKMRKPEELIVKDAPVEIKFLAEYGTKIETVWDMINSERRWITRYPAQLITYMLLKGNGVGLFLIYSKANTMPHHIWFDFDQAGLIEYGEELLQKAERIWSCIEAKIPADRVDPGKGLCFDCDFLHLCKPDMYFGPGAQTFEDERMVTLLDRYYELAPFTAEFEKVKKDLKNILNGVENGVAGPYIISGKRIEVGPKSASDGYSFWKWKAKKVNFDSVDLEEGGKDF
jgi:hypothetical protein